MFTSISTCLFGFSGIFSLLCTTEWTCVRISHRHKWIRFVSCSVGIVCMVNPDADRGSALHDNSSIASQRNIPASCHKHTMQKSRTVNCFFFAFRHLLFLYHPINSSQAKFYYGRNQHVVSFLAHSIGVMH